MTPFPLKGVLPRFLRLIEMRAPADAAALAVVQIQLGYRPEQVIRDLLAPAQAEAGRRWHQARWTIADEHQATAVTDAALYGVTSAGNPPRGRSASRGSVAVVCALGDWHTLPSRMAAELLRLDDWDVLFLGGSLPPADLQQWLADARPDVLVVSCSMPTTAAGAADTAAAATAVGTPVVAGGRGMGSDATRATALGVRWAPDLTSLEATLAAPAPRPDPAVLADRRQEHGDLLLRRHSTVATSMEELARRWLPLSTLTEWQLARTREDFGHILDFLAAAVITADPRVFAGFVDWLTTLLTARGLPATVVPVSLRALAAALPAEHRLAGGLMTTVMPSMPVMVE